MLSDDLKNTVQGEVFDDAATLKKFSRDASLFEVEPKVVVAPQNVSDIEALVRFINENRKSDKKLSLTVRSGGTDMSGGPLSESIVLDMARHFNQILDIGTDYAVAQPGVYYRDFERETLRRNLLMPAYPASREICTIGGMAANNSGGEKTLQYGKAEQYILELKVVLSDGNEYLIKPLSKKDLDIKMKLTSFEGKLYKATYNLITKNLELITKAKPQVSKNSAGYFLWNVYDPATGMFDLTRLIVGSQGTLGIITEIKWRLVPIKKVAKMLVVFLKEKDLAQLGTIAVELVNRHPESLESYDDNTLKLALKFFPQLLKILKPKNMLAMAWHLMPEAWILITGGMPKLVLMAEFTGDSEAEVDTQLKEADAALKKFGVKTRITKTEDEEKEFWVIRRESFNLLRNKIKDKQTAPFIDDVVVRPEQLPEFLPRLTALLKKYDKLVYTIAGHVGNGNFHIIPLMNLSDPLQRAIIPKLSEEVYSLVAEFKGSITAEHNDGLIRSPYLEKMYGPEVIKLFTQVKDIFDPQRIFNPGKKVEASLVYSLSHLKRG